MSCDVSSVVYDGNICVSFRLTLVTLLQLLLLQQHARRGDIAAAIESAIGSLQVSLREQQLDVWSRATAAAEALACGDEAVVCAVCLEQLYYLPLPSSISCASHLIHNCQCHPPATAMTNMSLPWSGECSACQRYDPHARHSLPPLQHVFHDKCVRSWLLQQQATCPLCRL